MMIWAQWAWFSLVIVCVVFCFESDEKKSQTNNVLAVIATQYFTFNWHTLVLIQKYTFKKDLKQLFTVVFKTFLSNIWCFSEHFWQQRNVCGMESYWTTVCVCVCACFCGIEGPCHPVHQRDWWVFIDFEL